MLHRQTTSNVESHQQVTYYLKQNAFQVKFQGLKDSITFITSTKCSIQVSIYFKARTTSQVGVGSAGRQVGSGKGLVGQVLAKNRGRPTYLLPLNYTCLWAWVQKIYLWVKHLFWPHALLHLRIKDGGAVHAKNYW